ncbi:MAG TPA: translocation/assembly module TamB domain-containing protein [Steroidobacteraceae bacterium]
MRRRYRVLLGIAILLIALPVLLMGFAYWVGNSATGRDWIERGTARLSSGHVQLRGLGGRFPQQLELAHLELRDTRGLWLTIDGLQMDWSPLELLSWRASVQRLQAARVNIARAPAYEHPEEPRRHAWHWPHAELERLEVARLELGAPLTGKPVALQINGSGTWFSLRRVSLQLLAHRLDEVPSTYRAALRFGDSRLQGEIELQEDRDGPLAHLVQLPSIGALSIHLLLDGPPEAVGATLHAQAGDLRADVSGTVNLQKRAASLRVAVDATAMTPRPGLSWQGLHLQGEWTGPLATPLTTAQLEVTGLEVPGLEFKSVTAQLQGHSGALTLAGSVGGLKLPGPFGALLADSPIAVHASMRLDEAGRPLDFTLAHRLLRARGRWSGGNPGGGAVTADVPDLRPLAALAHLDLSGQGRVQAQLRHGGDSWQLQLSSALACTDGHAGVATLFEPQTRIAAAMTFGGSGTQFQHVQLSSNRMRASAHGRYQHGAMDLAWSLALPDVSALWPRLTGNASAQGHIQGQAPRLALAADIDGQLGVMGSNSGAVHLILRARDVPQRPVGQLQLAGTFDDAPLVLEASVQGAADGSLEAQIERAGWKSVHAQGGLTLPAGTRAAVGHLALSMEHLEDLDHLLGRQLLGSVDAQAEFDATTPGGRVRVRVSAKDVGVPAQQLAMLQVSGEIDSPATHPTLDLQLTTQAQMRGVPVHAQAQMRGPLEAVALRLEAGSEGDQTTQTSLITTAILDDAQREVRVKTLQVHYRDQTAHLLAPVLFKFADGFALERLRIGVGKGILQIEGRLTPALELSVSLNDVTPELLHPWLPDVDADGRLDGEAALHGTLALPTGTVQLKAAGLHARSGSARALPAGQVNLQAQLQATVAQLTIQCSAGERVQLHATGQAPLNRTAPIALKINGTFDLVQLNPILEASGQRLLGQIKLDADIGGTMSAPQARGSVLLTGGDVQDYPRGLHLTNISATLAADGEQVRLQQFVAHAGTGTLSASGTMGLTGGWPLNLKLEAHDAQPLSSDLVTANVNMDFAVTGELRRRVEVEGRLHINHADLNIPNALPPSVAVLDVRRPGQQAAPESANWGGIVHLNFSVDAPRAIFVRGRGLNAEVGGELHVGGRSDEPNISGGFDLRSGTINLAGTTLTFTSGKLSFNGTGVKHKIDPTLDFTATSTAGGVTSTLNIGGYADAPVITLSSTPEMAQDEILSRLLFGVSVTQLSTLQIAQIAAALATMSGVGGGGFNPVNAVQRALRLDRLAISGNTNGGAPTSGTTPVQGTNTGAIIEAGRYVSSRVYVGGRQFTTGTTQAEVQVDLTKGLKIQTTLGTGGGTVQGVTPQNDPGSSIGLSYQFEY